MRTDLEQPVGEKKPYVPSDVIKAKNYLFALCIHGEIVSTGSETDVSLHGHFGRGRVFFSFFFFLNRRL